MQFTVHVFEINLFQYTLEVHRAANHMTRVHAGESHDLQRSVGRRAGHNSETATYIAMRREKNIDGN